MRKRKRYLPLVLMLVGLALLVVFVYISGPRRVWEEVRAVGLWGFLAVTANVVAILLSWMMSWSVLLRSAGVRVPWSTLAGSLLSGFAVSYLTPSMHLGGEPVRAYAVARRAGVPMSRVVATVVLERLLAALALVCVAAMGGLFVLASRELERGDKQGVAVGLGVIMVFVAVGLLSFARDYRWLSRGMSALARRAPGRERMARASVRIAEMEEEVHRALRYRPLHTLLAFGLQLLVVFLNYLRPLVFFYFTQRIVFGFSQLSLYFTLNVFLTTVFWVTPGGLGIAEGGRMGILALLGIPGSGAIAFSVVYRFVEMMGVLIGIVLMLRWGAMRVERGLAGVEDRADPASGGEQG